VALVLGSTVQLGQSTDTDGLAQVDVAGKGSSSDVEPVRVVRGLLLVGTSLDNVNPDGDLDLS